MNSLKDSMVRLAGRGVRREKVLVGLLDSHFGDEAAVQSLFKPYFRFVATRTVTYTIGRQRNFTRIEVFWRCSDSKESLMCDAWNRAEVSATLSTARG